MVLPQYKRYLILVFRTECPSSGATDEISKGDNTDNEASAPSSLSEYLFIVDRQQLDEGASSTEIGAFNETIKVEADSRTR